MKKRFIILLMVIIIAILCVIFATKNLNDNKIEPLSTKVQEIVKTPKPVSDSSKSREKLIDQVRLFNDDNQEDEIKEAAIKLTFSLLEDYLKTPESYDDDLKWTELDLKIMPESNEGRFIEVIADPFFSHTGGKANGHWLIYQYQDNGKINCSFLWKETNLIYSNHVHVENRLLVVGYRATHAGSIFIGQWKELDDQWEPETLSKINSLNSILSVSDMQDNIIYGDSENSEISLSGNEITITDSNLLTINLTYDPNQGGLMENSKKQEDWIYFINKNDDYKLYKKKSDESELTLINDAKITSISVLDDWIYYTSFDEVYQFNKIKTDGTSQLKIRDAEFLGDPVEQEISSVIDGGWIIFKVTPLQQATNTEEDKKDEEERVKAGAHTYQVSLDGKVIKELNK